MSCAVRISLHGRDELRLVVVDRNRLAVHGFGVFLEDYKPDEVEITEPARQALLKCPYRSGLQAVEFFAGRPILGWCSGQAKLGEVSVHKGAQGFIRTMAPAK